MQRFGQKCISFVFVVRETQSQAHTKRESEKEMIGQTRHVRKYFKTLLKILYTYVHTATQYLSLIY